jgi:uncharacterized protein YutE (UPF0331/DUF86 family)
MTVPDDVEEQILDKATYVEEAVSVLAAKQSLDEEEYRADREQRAVVEREFHTAVEACIDIAGLPVGATDATMPETYAERFQVLDEHGVLSSETSTRMQQAAGFRNVLAHRYGDEVDDGLVYEHLQSELEWVVRFLREVRDYLADSGAQ